LNYTPPQYPPEAEKAGIEADVTLKLDIDASGKVTKAVVVEPVGHGFDESAVEAAMHLQFDPARKADGTPVAVRILYRYRFTLRPQALPRPPPTATTAELQGTVVARGGDAPIVGATVTVRSGPTVRTDKPDAHGMFRFTDLPPGQYRVTVSAEGFEPFS